MLIPDRGKPCAVIPLSDSAVRYRGFGVVIDTTGKAEFDARGPCLSERTMERIARSGPANPLEEVLTSGGSSECRGLWPYSEEQAGSEYAARRRVMTCEEYPRLDRDARAHACVNDLAPVAAGQHAMRSVGGLAKARVRTTLQEISSKAPQSHDALHKAVAPATGTAESTVRRIVEAREDIEPRRRT